MSALLAETAVPPVSPVTAHSPAEAGKPAARKVAEAAYKQFVEHLGKEFSRGHRFLHDLPRETIAEDGQPSQIDAR